MAEMNESQGRLRLGLLGLLLVAGFLILRLTPAGDLLSSQGALDVIVYLRSSAWAPILFVILYTGAVALALPGTILTLTGGAVFGFWGGVLFNSIGANLGANLAFVLSRALGRNGVRHLLRGENIQRHMDRLDGVAERHGFRGLLVLRLIPAAPFNILNFGPGLTAMSWRAYAGATLIGILPGTAVYTLFADALLQGSQEASREAYLRALLAGVLLAALTLIPVVLKKMKISLPGATGSLILLGTCGGSLPLVAQSLPDHRAFDVLLERIVDPPLVDYEALVVNRGRLDQYVESLGLTDPEALGRAPRGDQLAFWINAYNACMLKIVADHYPIRRGGAGVLGMIRNRLAGYPANSVWQIRDVFATAHCGVAGADRSQDEIEHEIIRPTFGEPRIHFAVNCAARSCPVLSPEAYRADTLDDQLDSAVMSFIDMSAHFSLESGSPPTLRLNKVMEWYQDDFGGISGLKDFFGEYLEGDPQRLVRSGDTEVTFFEYDWTLNDTPR